MSQSTGMVKENRERRFAHQVRSRTAAKRFTEKGQHDSRVEIIIPTVDLSPARSSPEPAQTNQEKEPKKGINPSIAAEREGRRELHRLEEKKQAGKRGDATNVEGKDAKELARDACGN